MKAFLCVPPKAFCVCCARLACCPGPGVPWRLRLSIHTHTHTYTHTHTHTLSLSLSLTHTTPPPPNAQVYKLQEEQDDDATDARPRTSPSSTGEASNEEPGCAEKRAEAIECSDTWSPMTLCEAFARKKSFLTKVLVSSSRTPSLSLSPHALSLSHRTPSRSLTARPLALSPSRPLGLQASRPLFLWPSGFLAVALHVCLKP